MIDALVNRLAIGELGFERAEAAETGRPGYDPRDLLKLSFLRLRGGSLMAGLKRKRSLEASPP